MKKKIAISSVVVAIFVVLVVGVIPHHHHDDGAICFHVANHHETSREAPDNEHNKRDANHNHNTHSCHHDPTCIADANYYTSPESKIKIQASSSDDFNNWGDFQSFPIFYLVSDFLINPAYNIYTKPRQGEYLLFYRSAEVSRFHGLRAPPFILS